MLQVVMMALAAAFFAGCQTTRQEPAAPVLLISMDGFRWDYTALHPQETPTFRQLAREGVAARGLVPVFPSNTFPNHYAIGTGLYPSRSGMLNNRMFDAKLGEFFNYSGANAAGDGRWWGGEPIWVTAVKQGKVSACSFWPGSEAEIKGTRPTFWKPYNYSIPFEERLEEVVTWLKLPPEKRPAIITFYLEETNSVGHKFGPDSPELVATLKLFDERIATMRKRLAREGLTVNMVLVSDHGMAPARRDRTIVLDDYIDLKSVQIDFDESNCGLRPMPGVDETAVLQALAKIPNARVYRAQDLPRHLHIDPSSPRVSPIWILPEEGGHVVRRAVLERVGDKFVKGQHGYDPLNERMHGILIAHGPAFRRGVTLPATENIHIYNMLCAIAGLRPAPNDGDDRLVRAALK